MPAHATSAAEHARRTNAILQALAEGAAPPHIHPARHTVRAKMRALEIVNEGQPYERQIKPASWDSYLNDFPFPWPENLGERPKLDAAFLKVRGLTAAVASRLVMPPAPITPQEPLQVIAEAAPADSLEVRRLQDRLRESERRRRDAEARAVQAEDAYRTALDLSEVELDPADWAIDPEPASGQPGVPLLSLNDWHLSEIISRDECDGINEFNLGICEDRVKRTIQRTLDLCFEHVRGPGGERAEYPGIVVVLGGDMVSGSIHEEILQTNEVTRNASVILCANLIVSSLRALADAFGKVHAVCVPGNHGRDGKPRAKLLVATNADWLIYRIVEMHLANDRRITFQIPESGDARFTVAGLRCFATHGDRLGVKGGDGIIGSLGPIARGHVKLGQQQAISGRNFDVLLLHHYHQYIPLPRADVSNCLCGPNEYSLLILRAPPSAPSQSLRFVHPHWGVTSRWEVFCDLTRKPWNETSLWASAA
jgi:hypothetical protein